ncbi:hypothetical protein ACOSQ2_022581 [Xanthoceras sorbifolium]
MLYSWVVEYLAEFQGTKRCISSPSPSSLSGQSLAWCPPSIGCLKLNSDVAIRDCFGAVGVRVAIRDLVGDIVAAASKVLPGSFSAEVGEFLALREVMLVSLLIILKLFIKRWGTAVAWLFLILVIGLHMFLPLLPFLLVLINLGLIWLRIVSLLFSLLVIVCFF